MSSSEADARWGELMGRAQAGDAAAYRELLTEISGVLRGFLRRRLGDQAMVEDVLQDVLFAVHQSRASYDPERSFSNWCFAIAKYRLVDYYRKAARRAQNETLSNVELDLCCSIEVGEDSAHASLDIERMLEHLPEKQRELIKLVKLEGLSIREAARRTNSSEGAVKVSVHRALKSLRRIFEARPDGSQ